MLISQLHKELGDALVESGDGEVYMIDAAGEMLRITGVKPGLARETGNDGSYIWLQGEYIP